MIVALDAEALNALAGPDSARKQHVRRILRAAQRLGRDVLEDASLESRDTDRRLARIVGGVLAAANAGSAMIVDAHVVALAVEAGGGVVVTGDERDLNRLSAPYHHIVVEPV